MFTKNDLQFIAQKGIDKSIVLSQIEQFKKGFPFANLIAAATIGNGIIKFNKANVDTLLAYFDNYSESFDFIKFVPASGAASRMFKDLYEYMDSLVDGINIGIDDFPQAKKFFDNIQKFAFYPILSESIQNDGLSIDNLLQEKQYGLILEYLLTEKGLNYAKLPKALLLFHCYDDGNRLALEEHLIEGVYYSKNADDKVRIHFTVSKEHKSLFKQKLQILIPKYEKKYGITFEISYSEQKPSTDTIAVTQNNEPFRENDDSLLFRPGGHGALIENLNDLNAEIVFVKNIDNVVPNSLREPTYKYKKIIGAHLMQLQKKVFEYLQMLDEASFSEEDIQEIIRFVKKDLMIVLGSEFETLNSMEQLDYLFTKMNRPIRVCGMVKNVGEPGGGPFWVKSEIGESLQIVEGSQIDMHNEEQKQILDSATHFNPVDLVCSLKDFKGNAFDLTQFVDLQTGFISEKSKNGRSLKALELPGLWNGAMADWITIFVEVPIETFNPVKTVNDLLRPQHIN